MRASVYIAVAVFGAVLAVVSTRWLWFFYILVAALIFIGQTIRIIIHGLPTSQSISSIVLLVPSLISEALQWPVNLVSWAAALTSIVTQDLYEAPHAVAAALALRPPVASRPTLLLVMTALLLTQALLNGATPYHSKFWLAAVVVATVELGCLALDPGKIILVRLRRSTKHIRRTLLFATIANVGLLVLGLAARSWDSTFAGNIAASAPSQLQLSLAALTHPKTISSWPFLDRRLFVISIGFALIMIVRLSLGSVQRSATDYGHIAAAYSHLKKFKEAVSVAKDGLLLDPSDRECNNAAAGACLAEGDYTEALQFASGIFAEAKGPVAEVSDASIFHLLA
jgi:hypothetical protein